MVESRGDIHIKGRRENISIMDDLQAVYIENKRIWCLDITSGSYVDV